MDLFAVVLSSALVSAVVGAGAAYFSQRSLARRQALLDYEYNAKKRLYEAIGPLRFQLLIACRDVVRRVEGHTRAQRWAMDSAGYFGSNTLYRLLRPLAICTLIERKMNAADFSVDPDTVALLRFEVGAYRMLTKRDPLPYYEDLDWAVETQHVFRDNLKRAAAALIKDDPRDGATIMDYTDFVVAYPDPIRDSQLAPLAGILAHTQDSLADNPVFWTRVVGYAYLCQRFIDTHGGELGFSHTPLPVRKLVGLANDRAIQAHADQQEDIFRQVEAEGL